ncbi:methyl-accepting chemotaxis protein [Pseudoduganella namucuonensis]|uniref:Methyl-accepting chemotaxis protein-1, serine sensor receptor n=1 Tax=Pseudoduganella namucuonensis TaxID=1035707 RepID=A0A1I7LEH9_9BURK|nr:methyl-accepting chemotaxis protein [Pseudoduganella namucuonensis]SFV07996.1 methyl-accepting chemotaxis protein-1, serine sensor receptor [Pseudoduganella namucuonensis]
MKVHSIAFRLNFRFLVIITSLLSLFGAVNYVKTKGEREAEIERQVQAAISRMTMSLPIAIWNSDKKGVEQGLRAEMSAGFIVGIVINNGPKIIGGTGRAADGSVTIGADKPRQSDASRSAKLAYIEDGKPNPVGEVTVFIAYTEMHGALHNDLMWLALAIFVLNAVLLFALSHSLNSVVLRPLKQVREALHNIAVGDVDLTKRLPASINAEFTEVADNFNTFIGRLQKIIEQVHEGTDLIAAASSEIATGNLDLSARTESQASSLEETSAAMAELTKTVNQNAGNAKTANHLVQSASDIAGKGGVAVAKVIATMTEINDASHKIVNIIAVIDSIAFQTNILALNAAVEAARAGEQGRGFAVVASEVRNLAHRSAAAAQEIKTLISDSVDKVGTGTELVNQAGQIMNEVVTSVKQVTEIMTSIMTASEEQTVGIAHACEAISLMDQTTQQNAALVEEAAATADSLKVQTAALETALSVFRLSETAPRLAAVPSAAVQAPIAARERRIRISAA